MKHPNPAGLRSWSYIGTISFFVFMVGCTVYVPPTTSLSGLAWRFDAPFDELWQAIVSAFAERNLPIKTIDKSSGIIASEAVTGTIGSHMDCGGIQALGTMRSITGTGQGTFNVFVTKDGPSAAVQVNSRWATTYVERNLRSLPESVAGPVFMRSDGGGAKLLPSGP